MEKDFYTDNFEKYLKGHADQFKMMPSKKIWHGIYNDLHPGRRWPSITMSIIFIFSLVIVGHLNTNNEHANDFAQLTLFGKTISVSNKSSAPGKSIVKQKTINSDNITTNNTTTAATDPTSIINSSQTGLKDQEIAIEPNKFKNLNSTTFSDKNIGNPAASNENSFLTSSFYDQSINTASDNLDNINNNDKPILTNTNFVSDANSLNKNVRSNTSEKNEAANVQNNKKAKGNVTYYLGPTLSYRSFSDPQINGAVTQRPMPGLEIGTAVDYKISKQLQFITGLQVNYSGYNIKTNTTHPILSTLILNTVSGQPIAYSAVSLYGNHTGNEKTRLKNYSVMASIPLGLQYVFAENDNVQFSAQATFQPSFAIANKAYLLSTDEKNYITDPDLFRTWNMSTNFGTYISFKSNSFKWQIGPQVHYQLLSTYTKNYSLKEHLLDYGIRFGISKISK